MSELVAPSEGLVFCSVLYRSDFVSLDQLKNEWDQSWGPSEVFTHYYFPMKRYYSKEMGPMELLQRAFFFGSKPTPRENLIDSKLWAVNQELKFRKVGNRAVNWDTGMISLENVQLATSKNYIHRIYLGRGVFSELTLTFEGRSYRKLAWTYPDYQDPEIVEEFNRRRKFLQKSLNI